MTRANPLRRAMARGRTIAANDTERQVATPLFWLSAALLSLAFVFGGESRDNPLSTMMVELLGVTLLAATVWSRVLAGTGRVGWPEAALLGVIFLVPVLQLIPLPPSLWMTLPGRHEAVETLRIAGIEPGWSPLSLDPEATFRSVLWLVPPTALFLAIADLDTGARVRLVGVVLALCIASLILGGLQITDRDGGLFASPAGGRTALPIGFFANRNHQGIAMAAALPLAAASAAIWGSASSQRTRAANIVFAALVALLIVGVLVTRSRAALTLSGPALLASIGLFWAASGAKRLRREAALMIGAAAVALVLAAQFAIRAMLDRFETLADGDGRFDIWPSTVKAGADVAPFGAGLGAFESFYRAWEPLERMGPTFINHAHNDYLELFLEAGWPGVFTFLAFFTWLVPVAWRAWAIRSPQTALARAGTIIILLLLIHSVVDYPLRTFALSGLFALACGLIAAPALGGKDARLLPGSSRRRDRSSSTIPGDADGR
ncbi:MAG: O-antigen ligase family protein [Caulobacter sp.]|nr:O-antigen ligase family protein [Caulobacter sp.]